MSLVSVEDLVELIQSAIKEDRFNLVEAEVNGKKEHGHTGILIKLRDIDALIFGYGSQLTAFKKIKGTNTWLIMSDYSHGWEFGELNDLFPRMETLQSVMNVTVFSSNHEVNHIIKQREIVNCDILCEKIAYRRNHNLFGWTDDYKSVKGVVYTLDDLQIIAYASGSYITIGTKQANETEWQYRISHDSCWRYDGINRVIKNNKNLISVEEVLVKPAEEKTIGEVTYL